MPEETTETTANTAAAKRRAAKSRPTLAEASQTAEVPPTPEPAAPVAPGAPVVVSRAMVAEYTSHMHTGVTGSRLPVDDMVYGRPAMSPIVPIQPSSNMYGTIANDQHYVVAEFDAYESMVPEGARQPVSRLLWNAGWRVYRPLYEAVAARTSPEDQAAAALAPAKLPDGVDQPPADMVAPQYADTTASPVIRR